MVEDDEGDEEEEEELIADPIAAGKAAEKEALKRELEKAKQERLQPRRAAEAVRALSEAENKKREDEKALIRQQMADAEAKFNMAKAAADAEIEHKKQQLLLMERKLKEEAAASGASTGAASSGDGVKEELLSQPADGGMEEDGFGDRGDGVTVDPNLDPGLMPGGEAGMTPEMEKQLKQSALNVTAWRSASSTTSRP